jgi:hypothetical protein
MMIVKEKLQPREEGADGALPTLATLKGKQATVLLVLKKAPMMTLLIVVRLEILSTFQLNIALVDHMVVKTTQLHHEVVGMVLDVELELPD